MKNIKWIVLAIVLVVLGASHLYKNISEDKQVERQKTELIQMEEEYKKIEAEKAIRTVNVYDITNMFINNYMSAQVQYEGKVVNVAGYVVAIEERENTIAVIIRDGGTGSHGGVFHFRKEYKPSLMKVKLGQPILLKGKAFYNPRNQGAPGTYFIGASPPLR